MIRNRLVLAHYFDSAVLVVCPSHVFKGQTCPICLVNFYKGDDGRKINIKNAERRVQL